MPTAGWRALPLPLTLYLDRLASCAAPTDCFVSPEPGESFVTAHATLVVRRTVWPYPYPYPYPYPHPYPHPHPHPHP